MGASLNSHEFIMFYNWRFYIILSRDIPQGNLKILHLIQCFNDTNSRLSMFPVTYAVK